MNFSIEKLILLLLLSFVLHAENNHYNAFINEQISYIKEMRENNISDTKIEEILTKQKESYSKQLNEIMSIKENFIATVPTYESEIYSLKKIITINQRAGNRYAVLRDKVKIKSYQILANQNRMIQNILSSLNSSVNTNDFENKINDYIVENQLKNSKITSTSYQQYLEIHSSVKTLKQLKKSIEEFNILVEMNQDMINYIYQFKNSMFRLNKYSKYHLISIVLYIKEIGIVKIIDPILEKAGLNIVKILFIVFVVGMIYILRKAVDFILEKYILNLQYFQNYAKNILKKIKKPIDVLLILININLIIYIYNDFNNSQNIAIYFNVFYTFIFTYMVYKILNSIAAMKIDEIDRSNKEIKNEVINLTIKIVNFIIFIVGILIVLYLIGVDLTAVLSGLGIGGFAVALAAKDSLANFFGTLSILLSDVFSQGDWIVIDGKEGVVVEIGLRVTTLRTFDNALIAIPNATLANKDVKNWNKRKLGRRIKMSLGVKYDSSSDDIKSAIKDIKDMLIHHPNIATQKTEYQYTSSKAKLVSQDDLEGVKRTLLVFLDEFSDSSINILVYCFSTSTVWEDWLSIKEDVMHKIMEIFEKNHLEFAFPSLSLYNEREQ